MTFKGIRPIWLTLLELRARLECAVAQGVLINKVEAIKAQVRKESDFVRAVRRLRFDLPPKLHNVPFEKWPDIIDQVGTEVLATIIKRPNQVEE